jgi:predicted transcriptional regulator
MNTEINLVKSALLLLFKEGKTEIEAFEVISKTHSSHSVNLVQVKIWFKKFRLDERNLSNKKSPGVKRNYTNEHLIKLVNENPELNLTDLAKLTGTSMSNISLRLKEINMEGEKVGYIKKSSLSGTEKLTEESLIKLINDNPGLNMVQLAEVGNTSQSSISVKLRQINSKRPDDDKIILQKDKVKSRKTRKAISDEYLIQLVNENPESNMTMLAKLAGSSIGLISYRLKKINSKEKIVDYKSKKSQKGTVKLTKEALIKLIEDNPGFTTYELAKLADTSQSTISIRLKQINSTRPPEEKLTIQKKFVKSLKCIRPFSDEFVIKLVNENPEKNLRELAMLGDISPSTLSKRLKAINKDGIKAKYINKNGLGGAYRLTEESLISLINQNPGVSVIELAKLANSSVSTIYIKLKKLNSNRSPTDKIILKKDKSKLSNSKNNITNEDKLVKVNSKLIEG